MNGWGAGDRRREERVPLEMWMEEISDNSVAYRRTGDVSAGGVFFERIVPHPLGTTMILEFVLPGTDQRVRAKGEVVNVTPDGTGMGVKFIWIEGDGQAQLRAFLDQRADSENSVL